MPGCHGEEHRVCQGSGAAGARSWQELLGRATLELLGDGGGSAAPCHLQRHLGDMCAGVHVPPHVVLGRTCCCRTPHRGAGEQQPCGAGLRRCRTCGVSPTGHWFWHKKQAGSCKTPSTWVQLLSPGAEGFLQCALLAGTLQEISSFLTAVCAVGPVLP